MKKIVATVACMLVLGLTSVASAFEIGSFKWTNSVAFERQTESTYITKKGKVIGESLYRIDYRGKTSFGEYVYVSHSNTVDLSPKLKEVDWKISETFGVYLLKKKDFKCSAVYNYSDGKDKDQINRVGLNVEF